jgi:hypothetical protein
MGVLKKLIVAAGFATLGYLLWRFDARAVWAETSAVGLGFLVIIPFQIFDHGLNALAWRFAFRAQDARAIPLWRLVLARVAGDGVNYLTPSGNIAGEFIRPGMLADLRPPDACITSVILGKFAQALGQAIFIISGLLVLVQGRLDFLGPRQKAAALGASALIVCAVLAGFYVLTYRGRMGDWVWGLTKKFTSGVRENLRDFVKKNQLRMVLSILFFGLGYAWGALEVLLICYFLGVPMDLRTAMAVEVLSNLVDSLMFMVPAKIGTQEAGKTAIFHGLGLPARQGLALGLIRHVRELIWASAGLLIYSLHQRGALLPRWPGSPLPPREPAGR